MNEQLNILIVPHTHWDREWYLTFQQFRFRLVQVVDKLLQLIAEDDSYQYFMLDGQTIVLDDYLEVRPEQEAHLKQYTQNGRILVGPWYLQPDEFLVSGESLIRNLQIGLARAAEFGEPMRVGYVPDCFGHIAQLPQILQGVGIDNAVFWRGVGPEVEKSEFLWRAPDGSQVLVVYLADPLGYSNARTLPLQVDDFIARVQLLATTLLPKANTDTLLFMNGSDHLEPQTGLSSVITAANTHLSQLTEQQQQHLHHDQADTTRHYNAIHLQFGTLPQYLAHVRQHTPAFQTIQGEMRSSRYAHLLPSVLSTRMWIKQQNNATEQLLERWVEPLTAWATQLGASYPQGMVKTAWRYLLQNHPHDSICGCSIDQVHRENAVRFAQSQQIAESLIAQAMQQIAAHLDTTAPFPSHNATAEPLPLVVFNPAPGPRTERVQVEVQLPGSLQGAMLLDRAGQNLPFHVVKRWRQEIGSMAFSRDMLVTAMAFSGVTDPAQLLTMAQGMVLSALGETDEPQAISHVLLDDPAHESPHSRLHPLQAGVAAIEIMVAPATRVQVKEHELLETGKHIMALLEREDIHTIEITLIDQARETIEFVAPALTAYSCTPFWLYPHGASLGDATRSSLPILLAQQKKCDNEFYTIENEFYRVTVNEQDGTLQVTDRLTNVSFAGLNRFVDGGDIGDLYTYCPPADDTLVTEPLKPPHIELIHRGPVQATLRISSRWALPVSCTSDRHGRSTQLASCSIVSEVTLVPGLRRIDVHTRIENTTRDHRLRVLFPVSYIVEQVAVDGTFEVRMRSPVTSRPADITAWAEAPVNAFPQKRFVDLSNGTHGLAILNRGLPECEVIQQGEGQMAAAITLLRCVEWLSRGDLTTRHGHAGPMIHTPEAQCLGVCTFDYALIPHTGNWYAEDALILKQAQAFQTPLTTRAQVVHSHAGVPLASLVEVQPATLLVSAIKQANTGQGLVIRLYNPLDGEIEGQVRPGVAFTRAYMANLLEECLIPLEVQAGSIPVRVRGGGILTIVCS
jgi:mannosylglycerate hydrolase